VYDLSNGSISSDLNDPSPRFQGHGVVFMPIDALSVFYAQLTSDLLALAKFLYQSLQHLRYKLPTRVENVELKNDCTRVNATGTCTSGATAQDRCLSLKAHL